MRQHAPLLHCLLMQSPPQPHVGQRSEQHIELRGSPTRRRGRSSRHAVAPRQETESGRAGARVRNDKTTTATWLCTATVCCRPCTNAGSRTHLTRQARPCCVSQFDSGKDLRERVIRLNHVCYGLDAQQHPHSDTQSRTRSQSHAARQHRQQAGSAEADAKGRRGPGTPSGRAERPLSGPARSTGGGAQALACRARGARQETPHQVPSLARATDGHVHASASGDKRTQRGAGDRTV